ncbi:MAG: NAD-dependent epimerase/dehydratase family protein [Candidatus Bathyarchaeota archaeon]|nr:NAD-dependent epimerase/dehydratase family protein [Candidatus Bathyarchaeota archaeon]
MKVGITGQTGFIGSHLASYLKLKENISVLPFHRDYLKSETMLDNFLQNCDAVVHLAGMNRGPDSEVYETNISLAETLVKSLERAGNKPHVIYSSSIHEAKDTSYGKSKKESRLILSRWANENNAKFTGLVTPNVYGPFCKPFYNSVVATFCYQLTHEQKPEIHVDQSVSLLYVNTLVHQIYEIIKTEETSHEMYLPPTREVTVSGLLAKLIHFKEKYMGEKTIPALSDPFDLSLFNTFRSYIETSYFPVPYEMKADDRGYLFEIVRSLNQGQVFFSTTKPGIERGNHYHRRKVERFTVIKGKAKVQLRRIGTKEIIEHHMDGEHPSYIDMPIHYTHNLVNTGQEELHMLFWASELYNPEDPDTFYEQVQEESR